MNETKKKILVVDDEKDTVLMLTNILRRAQYDTLSASSGKEALTLARSFSPDVIILDIVLGDMDGGDVAFELSRDPATAHIPIIFLTGVLSKGEGSKIKTSGKRYVLAKPTTAEELFTVINKVLPA
ncbi:MAG: response regulator [Candidatus Omnitrophota bacterium]|nr:response regulator [Candidatus Omnitrophota bacterium]